MVHLGFLLLYVLIACHFSLKYQKTLAPSTPLNTVFVRSVFFFQSFLMGLLWPFLVLLMLVDDFYGQPRAASFQPQQL